MLVPEAIRQRALHGQLALPVVIVAGEKDRLITTRWHSSRLQERIAGSRLHIVPGAGHMVHHSAPEAVFEAIREVSSLVTPQTPVDLDAPLRIAPEDEPLRANL